MPDITWTPDPEWASNDTVTAEIAIGENFKLFASAPLKIGPGDCASWDTVYRGEVRDWGGADSLEEAKAAAIAALERAMSESA